MKVVYTPPEEPRPPRKPSWWRTFFKQTGTIVNHNGVLWELVEYWSWGEYGGRDWERYEGTLTNRDL